MDIQKNIKLKKEVTPQVYAYTVPHYGPREGWVKIGYTTRDVDKRIKEQSHTVGVETKKLWDYVARYNNEEYFKDHDFHNYLQKHGVKRDNNLEWFYFGEGNEMKSDQLFRDFTFRRFDGVQSGEEHSYVLREEQEEAVSKAYEYATNNPESEFLWNAKPRFGKTLSAYDLARKLDAKNVLIVTNRPAIANSWLEDFNKFIGWQTDYKFVSESNSLKGKEVLTRDEFIEYAMQHEEAKQINFLSLQDLKGSMYHGGAHDKLEWVSGVNWDMLIIDEAHEGIDTFKTDYAFDNIKRQFTLHLSGTPFKAISSGKFSSDQIFNWTYEDEQEVKNNWDEGKDGNNPYEELPKMNMFTYRMSNMITDEIKEGAVIDGESMDYAFDLNEFFATNKSGQFIHKEDVLKWLDTLTTNEKYPFSTPELRDELKHTFWMLDRVDSAKALARELKKHPVFEHYEIIVAAGDGRLEEDMEAQENSLHRVQEAIKKHDRTITLSVGQLTTGVTVPEWSAVLMLSNIKSAALYMQAAFRSQNPRQWNETINGKSVRLQKINSYVFDFAPERTLMIFDEFANNLSTDTATGGGTSDDREENIKRLLNFFPVIGEDEEGEMKELDFKDVITIPRQIKATEVVRRGFMSNLLFANISGIFSAPQAVLDVLDNLKKEEQGRLRQPKENVDTKDVKVDDEGQVEINQHKVNEQKEKLLGDKVFEYGVEVPNDAEEQSRDDLVTQLTNISTRSAKLTDDLDEIRQKSEDMTVKEMNDVRKNINEKIEVAVWERVSRAKEKEARAKNEFNEKIKNVKSDEEKEKVTEKFKDKYLDIYTELEEEINTDVSQTIEEATEEYVEAKEVEKVTEMKDSVEEDVRSRLRGFARTIPSFIMAYGEDDLTLSNFDTYIPEDVFKEVTGITIGQFKFLRDGGEYEEDGEIKHFRGNLFDEVVFNESVQEFLRKKEELANYFENQEEDIFDYIPPQETNQIYTPKRVVQMMVDSLEEENPGIYDDSSKTFIDLYMKSGLYITEIVKKLYNSEQIKKEFPNDEDRIKHILENQVYGFAPSEIIYNIATRFIFGEFDDEISQKNFLQVDTTPYAQEGTMQELIDEKFGSQDE